MFEGCQAGGYLQEHHRAAVGLREGGDIGRLGPGDGDYVGVGLEKNLAAVGQSGFSVKWDEGCGESGLTGSRGRAPCSRLGRGGGQGRGRGGGELGDLGRGGFGEGGGGERGGDLPVRMMVG